MGIDPRQFRALIIRPACAALSLGGDAAEELLLGTAIQESGCGQFLHQEGGGPALGVFQMEPEDHDDIWRNYLPGRPALSAAVKAMLPPGADRLGQLVSNLVYAAAMARIHYARVPEMLPASGDLKGQAAYYKAHYNTAGGAATPAEYIANWQRALGNPGA